MRYFDLLKAACNDVDLEFDKEKYEQFIKYKALIKEWNKKINLTAINDDDEIIKKHFIDSIKVFRFSNVRKCKKIIDVGTGGGFPGIPIKIVYPECDITLLDSLNKRVKFLNTVINELELKNIEALHGRAEDLGIDKDYREKYDIVVSRAVANMTVLSEYCIPFAKVGGYFIALKGPAITEELNDAKNAINILGGKLEKIENVDIEGSELEHNLVIVKKIKSTNRKYPRKAGIVSKKPLK
ncbi:ribosomal RNA small subunit methyltransferase G [Clostridium tepidiprofundi DSM 19306]|uniref:Ribosomal RNA small subunit methyltransferase G n=1 Tax=Clostridium tepidiprofundi DSM 19306 TaxID=1121338 RepID=A0A151B2I6_9CLOT|nr:16S rRNA (guanine(527)-N(7))-methyltransferase RsmG [Clostridium tepidiprofundi]KYH34115.1 ribosomal RNA small subunit methyltransferase G [Clostridium tepidiprofundi DSM 19306]